MKKFSELMEKSGDTAVFTFGRLNPPTTGHGKLIDAMAREQGKNVGSKMHVFVSHSQDAKKNPLDYKRKVAYIRKMFPKYAKNILTDKAKTIFEVAVSLHNKGYKSIIMVVGSDRVDEFERLLNEYKGVQSKHGYYGFDNVEVVSAGERDPDAEGLEGMSASKMRKAAMDGDLDSFKQGVPDGFKDAEKLYKDVRKSMGIREEKNMGEMDIYEEVRDAYLTGKIWNVGDIVEANGMSGEIVRKGTNYISYMTEDNKVHKAWLHEIELEGVVGDALKSVAKKAKDKAVSKVKSAVSGVTGTLNVVKKAKQAVSTVKDSGNVIKKAKQAVSTAKDSTNVFKKAKQAVSTAKDSANVVKKAKQAVGAVKSKVTSPVSKLKKLVNSERVELDEMSWFLKAKAKIDQMSHPKAYEAMIKQFVGDMKNPPKQKTPASIAANIAREYSVSARGLIQYINKLVDKGVIPKELKAEYQEESFSFKNFVEQIQEVKQDPDVKDMPGTQPAKYHSGVKSSVKDDRDRHFKAKKAGPAPGDKGAVTKPSVHTKKYKQMFGEQKIECPPATKDLAINTKNRDAATKKYNYGPLNVDEPGDYWEKIAKHWKTTEDAAKKSLCENCVAFDVSPRMKECLPGATSDDDGELGYCWMHHFKCHSARACHTWAKGGPIDKDKESNNWQERAFGENKDTKKNHVHEVLDKNADVGDYVKDFKKSDAPQFKGKSDKKKQKMAVAAYLSRNEALLDRVDQKLTENGHTDVASMKNKVAIAYKALEKMQGELGKLGDEDELPTWWTNKVATAVSRIDDMADYLDTQVDEAYQLDEKIAGLIKKADKSNISYGILKKVYDRGMAAWKTGHRPGTTPQQWAFARVNSFITKGSGTWGKADKDLASQVRETNETAEVEESLWANIAAKRKRIKSGSGEKMRKKGEKGAPTPTQIAKAKNEVAEACWDTHKQVGMKKKGGKMVPDCVPKSEEYEDELNEWGEIEEDSEYQGRKVKLNKPMAGDVKKSKVYVKNEKGNVVKVEFGDPNMTIKKHIPARRKSFRARHNCDNPGPKWMARYWSCKAW